MKWQQLNHAELSAGRSTEAGSRTRLRWSKLTHARLCMDLSIPSAMNTIP